MTKKPAIKSLDRHSLSVQIEMPLFKKVARLARIQNITLRKAVHLGLKEFVKGAKKVKDAA